MPRWCVCVWVYTWGGDAGKGKDEQEIWDVYQTLWNGFPLWALRFARCLARCPGSWRLLITFLGGWESYSSKVRAWESQGPAPRALSRRWEGPGLPHLLTSGPFSRPSNLLPCPSLVPIPLPPMFHTWDTKEFGSTHQERWVWPFPISYSGASLWFVPLDPWNCWTIAILVLIPLPLSPARSPPEHRSYYA